MELRPGYKQTEVGVIPEDWEVSIIGACVDVLTGFPFPSRSYVDAGVKLLRGSNVKREGIDWADDLTKHWPAISGDIAKYELKSGDVVVAMDGSLVGRSFAALTEQDIPALLLQRVARLRAKAFLHQPLLAKWICSDRFTKHCDLRKTTTAIPHINSHDIKSLPIAIPADKTEQRAIATALSDADSLVESLEALIAKKRQIKQGAMQELLSGKRRLPGFSGEWEVKRLGDIGSTFGGLTGKSKRDFGHGDARYITFMNIMANVVIDCSTFESVDVKATESQNHVAKGDLFFNGSSETPEEVGMCALLMHEVEGVFLNSFCFGFRLREVARADGHYLTYYFRSQEGRELLKALAQGATRYNLSKTAFLKVSFPLPTFSEQRAIATVLSDMDAELDALTVKLAKAREVKQGMMQELLTGRIRLVTPIQRNSVTTASAVTA